MANAAPKAADDATPIVYGDASGFLNITCSIHPATPKHAPVRTAIITLGSLRFQIIFSIKGFKLELPGNRGENITLRASVRDIDAEPKDIDVIINMKSISVRRVKNNFLFFIRPSYSSYASLIILSIARYPMILY